MSLKLEDLQRAMELLRQVKEEEKAMTDGCPHDRVAMGDVRVDLVALGASMFDPGSEQAQRVPLYRQGRCRDCGSPVQLIPADDENPPDSYERDEPEGSTITRRRE